VYDSSIDRNCPFTQSSKFKTQQLRQAEMDRRRQLARERGAAIIGNGVLLLLHRVVIVHQATTAV
jgi:hypothetical protein